MTIWLTIIGMGLVTFATRAVPLLSVRGSLDARYERWLRYVPPAILSALVAPALVAPQGSLTIGPTLLTGLIGALVAWRTHSMALTIVIGLAVFWALRWLIGGV